MARRRLNQSDPTANTAVSNVMKSGRGSRRLLTVAFIDDRCLVRGPGISELLDRVDGGETAEWSTSTGAFIVTPAVARSLVVAAERFGYEITANG